MTKYILIDGTAVGYISDNLPSMFSILHASGLLNSKYRVGQSYFFWQADYIYLVSRAYTENFSNTIIAEYTNN